MSFNQFFLPMREQMSYSRTRVLDLSTDPVKKFSFPPCRNLSQILRAALSKDMTPSSVCKYSKFTNSLDNQNSMISLNTKISLKRPQSFLNKKYCLEVGLPNFSMKKILLFKSR